MQPEQPVAPTPQPNVAPPIVPRRPSTEHISTDMLEPGESLITIVRRHPIGIIGYYIEAFVALVLIIGASIFFMKTLGSGVTASWVISISIFGLAIVVFFLFVATYVYRQCRLLITDRSLVQVIQKSLFSRKVSRLSLSNVEDVSASANGILPSMLGYGTLLVQTAGEMDNFEFPFCPRPVYYADQIIEARQRYAVSLQENEMPHPADLAMRGQS